MFDAAIAEPASPEELEVDPIGRWEVTEGQEVPCHRVAPRSVQSSPIGRQTLCVLRAHVFHVFPVGTLGVHQEGSGQGRCAVGAGPPALPGSAWSQSCCLWSFAIPGVYVPQNTPSKASQNSIPAEQPKVPLTSKWCTSDPRNL